MSPFHAFKGFYTGTLALVLGPGTIVWLVDVANKVYVVEQHGQVIDQDRLSPLLAKRFTDAATGVRELERTVLNVSCLAEAVSA